MKMHIHLVDWNVFAVVLDRRLRVVRSNVVTLESNPKENKSDVITAMLHKGPGTSI